MYQFLNITLSTISIAYRTFGFMLLFNWFVAFYLGTPPISYGLAFGLFLTVKTLFIHFDSKQALDYEAVHVSEEEKFGHELGKNVARILYVTIAIFLGWLVQMTLM